MLKEEKISEINRQFRLAVNEFDIDEEDLLIGYGISRYMYKKCILQKEDLTQDRNLKLMVNFIDCTRGLVWKKGNEWKEVASIGTVFSCAKLKEDITDYISIHGASRFYASCKINNLSRMIANKIRVNPSTHLPHIKINEFLTICAVIERKPNRYLCK